MALHARSVALAAGAPADSVERVAAMIVEARDITLEGAQKALGVLAAESGEAATALEVEDESRRGRAQALSRGASDHETRFETRCAVVVEGDRTRQMA